MNDAPVSAGGASPVRDALRRPEFIYSLVLFLTAVATIALAISRHGALPPGYGAGTAAFFIGYGVFTIAVGYTHPRVGYVSFDRIAQVAGILVLGPVAAAWLNGLASLLYPWHRLRQGRPFIDVLTAALHNAGLMTLMILLCGLLYQNLGGPVPLLELHLGDVATLLLLMLSMQALNDAGMRVFLTLEERRVPTDFSLFAFIVESGAGLGGILVAIMFNRMELSVVVLLLLVLGLGMLTLRELAGIRMRLESLVEERIGEFDRYGRNFALAILDLDFFKRINDDFSHHAGDEEFLLCFPQADLAAAKEACEQIRMAVETTEWGLLVPGVRVTLSAGVTTMEPGFGRRELLGAADQALYAAKSGGRNRVHLAPQQSRTVTRFQR